MNCGTAYEMLNESLWTEDNVLTFQVVPYLKTDKMNDDIGVRDSHPLGFINNLLTYLKFKLFSASLLSYLSVGTSEQSV